jgi:hypothetical protein
VAQAGQAVGCVLAETNSTQAEVLATFRTWRTILAGNENGLRTTAYEKKPPQVFRPAAAIDPIRRFI